jgi:hypothetical protein
MNYRIFPKERGEMDEFPNFCKQQRRCVNFRIFKKQRGEIYVF